MVSIDMYGSREQEQKDGETMKNVTNPATEPQTPLNLDLENLELAPTAESGACTFNVSQQISVLSIQQERLQSEVSQPEEPIAATPLPLPQPNDFWVGDESKKAENTIFKQYEQSLGLIHSSTTIQPEITPACDQQVLPT